MPETSESSAPEPGSSPTSIAAVARFKRWLRPLMLILALGFMVQAGLELASRWGDSKLCHAPLFLSLSLFPLLVGAVIQGHAWIGLMGHLNRQPIPMGPALMLYLDSQLARYTPGKIGLPLVRMAGAARLGLTAKAVGGSILLEMLSWISTGALVGAGWLLGAGADLEGLFGFAHSLSLLVIAGATLALLLLTLVGRQHLPELVRRSLGVEGRGPLVPWTTPGAHLVYWLSWAAHGTLVVLGLCADQNSALVGAAYFVLAPVLGFVALVAPAGVGVREAVISLGLAGSMGAAPALAAGVASRIASLAADLCTWGVCRLLGARRGWT